MHFCILYFPSHIPSPLTLMTKMPELIEKPHHSCFLLTAVWILQDRSGSRMHFSQCTLLHRDVWLKLCFTIKIDLISGHLAPQSGLDSRKSYISYLLSFLSLRPPCFVTYINHKGILTDALRNQLVLPSKISISIFFIYLKTGSDLKMKCFKPPLTAIYVWRKSSLHA